MSSQHPSFGNETTSEPVETGDVATLQERKLGKLFQSSDDIEQYKRWRQEVPDFVRNVLEGALLGKEVRIDPAVPPLTREFLKTTQQLLLQPETDLAQMENLDPRLLNVLQPLQTEQIEDAQVNVYRILASKEHGFSLKLKWYEARLAPRLQWVLSQDIESIATETELVTVDDDTGVTLGMNDLKESNEALSSGDYMIHPAYNGKYRGIACEKWDPAQLRWSPLPRRLAKVTTSPLIREETKRTMRGHFSIGKEQVVPLPYHFVIAPDSLPQNATAFVDEYGTWYIRYDAEEPQTFSFTIAKTVHQLFNNHPPAELQFSPSNIPDELQTLVRDAAASSLPNIDKARMMGFRVYDHLEYSNDETLCEQTYKKPPQDFFLKVWEHKKADCDVANGVGAEVLQQAQQRVRMMRGHGARGQTKEGSTVLHDGSRHAWLEVWNPDTSQWEVLDLTPKGDPNVDEEDQENDLQPSPEGENEGQFAELLSDDDLEKLRKEIEESAKRIEERSKDPVVRYAEKANCSVEEARKVLENIQTLRQRHQTVLKECRRAWHEAVKKNLTVKQVYSGPVSPDEGLEIDDDHIVAIPIAKQSHDSQPLAFTVPKQQEQVERSFGGYELYIGADRSQSMNDIDPTSGRRKKDAQRDAVFLFVDSVMQNVVEMKRAGTLKHAMPVRICVATFGKQNEIVLPLTEQWGPAEQVKLYRTLDDCADLGTPDHLALQMLQEEMQKSPSKEDPKMHRAVLMFADGGSDKADLVREELERIRRNGTVAGGFGITTSGRAMEAVYAPDGTTIESIEQLPDIGVRYVVNLLKEWYNI